MVSDAERETPGAIPATVDVASTIVPWSMYALVSWVMTFTTAEPATPASPAPAPATATVVRFSVCPADTASPAPPWAAISPSWPT